jgi:hypothetical protein
MFFYIFIFISLIILTIIINAMVKHIWSGFNFNEDYTSQISYGRVLNFKTKVTRFQKTPIYKL